MYVGMWLHPIQKEPSLTTLSRVLQPCDSIASAHLVTKLLSCFMHVTYYVLHITPMKNVTYLEARGTQALRLHPEWA